mmetsp:Transcript_68367/g.204880  ORF Transcript_68367/g.204880 Transcript_68367/m.204880 type:complete len:247 (-) Transcript_68367:890-1630(-)
MMLSSRWINVCGSPVGRVARGTTASAVALELTEQSSSSKRPPVATAMAPPPDSEPCAPAGARPSVRCSPESASVPHTSKTREPSPASSVATASLPWSRLRWVDASTSSAPLHSVALTPASTSNAAPPRWNLRPGDKKMSTVPMAAASAVRTSNAVCATTVPGAKGGMGGVTGGGSGEGGKDGMGGDTGRGGTAAAAEPVPLQLLAVFAVLSLQGMIDSESRRMVGSGGSKGISLPLRISFLVLRWV